MPLSNFVLEAKSGVLQLTQVYVPAFLLLSSGPVPGRSVSASRETEYWSGVSFLR